MDWKKANALLVDPDDSFADRIGNAFAKMNSRAVLSRAHTFAQARALIAATPQDVVIAVLKLSDGTATDLLTTNGERSHFPLVVLAQPGEEMDAAAALEAGAIDCYVKNDSDVSDLPPFVLRCAREWTHVVERERAERTIVQLRSQVQQFQRLVSSGLMTRVVANEVENLLTPILGYAEIALAKIPPRGQARGEIEHVVRVARMAKEFVRDAMNRGNGNGKTVKPVNAGRIVDDVLGTLRPVAPPGVEIRAGKGTDDALVTMEASRLHRVIMNLCVNAFDAMQSSGGVLQVDIDTPHTASSDAGEGSYARVMVTDTGRGMEEKVAKHVFDPFFSTASQQERAGLGLFVVREIVESHGGRITVDSELGKGTVFQLLLPLSGKKPASDAVHRT